TKVVSGDFALPLPMIRPIRNGDAALFVPLARLRVIAGGEHAEVIVQTSVVGQRSQHPGGGLQPFRLDLGPRIYSELAQRAFARTGAAAALSRDNPATKGRAGGKMDALVSTEWLAGEMGAGDLRILDA